MTDGATLYIDGKWTGAADGAVFEVQDPSSDVAFGVASAGGAADARAALNAATAALPAWSRTTAYERSEILVRAHRLLNERAEALAQLMTREQGKPLRMARAEVRYAGDFLLWFAEEAKRVYGMTIPSARADQRFTVLRQPVGVVAAITPWNYPISMITRKVAPAIAAGCTTVLKPAEQTPLCAVAVFEILHEAGLPAGVANLVTAADPAPVSDVWLDAPAVRKLTFTGSTEVGKHLAARAAGSMKRVSMELGGHAPFLVFDDADVEHAAKGAALVKYLNTGQACICPNRIYVQRPNVEAFTELFTTRVAKLKVGAGTTDGVTVGPLIDGAAMQKMQRQVEDAVAKGARLLTGGSPVRPEGLTGQNFFAPTVIADVTPEMLIYREETFGPIAAIIGFDDESQAVTMANDTHYGLASYVYTDDLRRATRVTEALRFGMVGLNDINPTSAAAPFGGVGESGTGREGGPTGIDEYLDVKVIGAAV
ncbi:NAD-dependent succinate-semialdehyde dehydrogenase [Pseudonocardia oroxyli]|uniref:Succinate-semialdehyde dehydrogenase / glutarate-semialdehyde dehydrogenase n=1 Tax=Pseudonocardia oroxyli TaxID=366584 RepID=A0A1G8EJ37_PSEOR|nr:NAD-dependent succinate-semialdehyde dehydrogenase [Pseudonocardia oroxyli]SDH69945.1 succinate-semialdehyde dehydrogenase / glutarate-semialdehyde dehydrogenase [Pseudonocardia oroxyli]